MPIESVSDTARWVAVYRAMESERPDALFRDPFARRLAGEKGDEIVRTLKDAHRMAWAMIVRTQVFDEIILDRVRNAGVTRVVNLAAGLDARAWRLAVPPTLHWIDVDFPDMIAYKTSALAKETPVCRYEAVATDLADPTARRALFDRLASDDAPTLVVAEGLLIYLTPEQVGALATDLARVPSARWWLIDLATPDLLKIMDRTWGKTVERGNAPFRFAPAEGTAFFAPLGWREASFRSSMDEARRLKREMSMMWLWRFLGRLQSKERQARMRRMSGIVLLERDRAG